MSILSVLKENLLQNLENAAKDLSEDAIDSIIKLKELGVKPFLKSIIRSKNFNEISLLPYVIALKSDEHEIKTKIKQHNTKIFNECMNIQNDIIYYEVMKKYFINPKNSEFRYPYKIVESLNDFETYSHKTKDEGFPMIGFIDRKYINPYTNNLFNISTDYESSSILHKNNLNDRKVKADVQINIFSQFSNRNSKHNLYYGLEKDFEQENLNRFDIEFTVFHELAHAVIPKIWVDDQGSECISDICGILRVIKNNNFSQTQALSYVNRKLNWRSNYPTLDHLSQDFSSPELKGEKRVRIHSTQFALLVLKNFIKEDYQYLKDLNINEEYIIASRATLMATSPSNIDVFLERNMFKQDFYRDISLDNFLNGVSLSEALEAIAKTRNTTSDILKDNIRKNVNNNSNNLFDLMMSHYAFDDQYSLTDEKSYSLFSTDILKMNLEESRNEKIDVNLDHKFSMNSLKSFISKNNVKMRKQW